MDTTNVVVNDKPADDGARSPHPEYKGEFIWIGDLIEARRAAGEKPTVGPYSKKDWKNGTEFEQFTEIWELEVVECAIFRFPKSEAFQPANARGIGDYLTMKHEGVEVMLLDGLQPSITGSEEENNFVTGKCHIRVKRVTASHGDHVNWYLFLKLFPTQAKPTNEVVISTNPVGERSYGYDTLKPPMAVSLAKLPG